MLSRCNEIYILLSTFRLMRLIATVVVEIPGFDITILQS
ncbi:hypothetical protein OsccyDRAFT_3294 [Leptolyngbyaceae cyanobacterium JSC-12]|nr:hypothetical protein OsccyDRAFT_3294 [Leptolyngbyaceae cyanobacterium JSC-12]